MNPQLKGLLRGLGYAIAMGGLDYLAKNIGASGLVSASVATIITGGVGWIEHYMTESPVDSTN